MQTAQHGNSHRAGEDGEELQSHLDGGGGEHSAAGKLGGGAVHVHARRDGGRRRVVEHSRWNHPGKDRGRLLRDGQYSREGRVE